MEKTYLKIKKTSNDELIVTKCKPNAPSEIVVSDGVIAICNKAFKDRKEIVSVRLPESIEAILENAFKGCESLTSIDVPDSILYIDESAFDGCSKINKPIYSNNGKTLVYVPKYVTEFAVPDVVRTIYVGAFKSCQLLKSITFPEHLETICHGAFEDCPQLDIASKPIYSEGGSTLLYVPKGVKHFSVPETVTEIGSEAFYGCNKLKSVRFNHEKSPYALFIDSCAFMNCKSLAFIELPHNVECLENAVFFGCNRLKTVRLPQRCIESISKAFYGCASLERIDLY